MSQHQRRIQPPQRTSSAEVLAESALVATIATTAAALGHALALPLGAPAHAHTMTWAGTALAWGAALMLSTILTRLRRVSSGARRRGAPLLSVLALGAAQLPFHGIFALGLFSQHGSLQSFGAQRSTGSPWARLQQENSLHSSVSAADHGALGHSSVAHAAGMTPSAFAPGSGASALEQTSSSLVMLGVHLLAWGISAAAFLWASALLAALLAAPRAARLSAEAAARMLSELSAPLPVRSSAQARLLFERLLALTLIFRRAAAALERSVPRFFEQNRPASAGFRGPPMELSHSF